MSPAPFPASGAPAPSQPRPHWALSPTSSPGQPGGRGQWRSQSLGRTGRGGLVSVLSLHRVASLSASVSPGVVTPARGGPGQGGGAPTRLRMKPCCVDTNLG